MAGEIVIFITASTNEEAESIADRLLDQRKAACVNIIPGVGSHFWWQGKKEAAEETLLIAKSRASLLDDVIRLVKEIHSYEVPEIIAIPIVGGSEHYLKWMQGEMGKKKMGKIR